MKVQHARHVPTAEIREVLDALFDQALTIPTQLLEYEDRMDRRKERRAKECHNNAIITAKRTRPSDGQPSGAPFDHEEYETKLTDRRAADPETYQRRKKARREALRAQWDGYKEQHDFDNCNAVLKEERLERERRYPGNTRLLDIWQWIINAEQAEKIDRIHLDQRHRIENAKRLRVRGVGAAARRAGYAD